MVQEMYACDQLQVYATAVTATVRHNRGLTAAQPVAADGRGQTAQPYLEVTNAIRRAVMRARMDLNRQRRRRWTYRSRA